MRMVVNYDVTSATDAGTQSDGTTGGLGTLSYAIAEINAGSPANTYTITLDANVALSGPLAPILQSVTIVGNSHTITASGTRIFFVGTDAASLAANPGTAIGTRQQVTIENVTLAGGTATGGAGASGGGGGLGAGGALFINQTADVTLSGVSFSGDSAVGGNGSTGASGGGGGLGGNGGGFGGGGGLFGSGGRLGGGGGGAFGTGGDGLGSGGGGGFSGDGGSDNGSGAAGQLDIEGLSGGGGRGGSGGGSAGSDGGGGGGSTNGGGGGGGFEGVAGGGSAGGRGGFGGGGGGAGGNGGFGGGGGYGRGSGGFGGGGGGDGGSGGFGGGGGSNGAGPGGAGGFGAGGGGGGSSAMGYASGGFGASAAAGQSGGGGAGLGGAIFVAAGGTLAISGGGTLAGTATGGTSGTGVAASGFGDGIFYQGTDGATATLTFDNSASDGDETISSGIADYIGSSGGTGAADQGGSLALMKTGTGKLTLQAEDTYSGGTTIAAGTVDDAPTTAGTSGIGTGAVTFGTTGARATLALEGNAQPANMATFANTLDNFDDGLAPDQTYEDALDLKGLDYDGSTTLITPVNNTLSVTESNKTETFTLGGTQAATYYAQSDGNGGTLITDTPMLCFAQGTAIRVLRCGAQVDAAVETLAVGDIVVTASGAARPIRWLGHRTIDCRNHSSPHDTYPVRIAAHAFGPNQPARDLFLSPGHPVLAGADADADGGHLVPIMCLINGTTVRREAVDTVTYWHVELDEHDILLAENLPAESYIDLGSRPWFAGAGALYDPDMAAPGMPGRCRPVAIDGPVVEAERRRLDGVFAMRLAAACAWPGAVDAHATK